MYNKKKCLDKSVYQLMLAFNTCICENGLFFYTCPCFFLTFSDEFEAQVLCKFCHM